MADLEGSYEARRNELAEAQAALRELGGLPQAKLDAALAALDKGETGKADELFAQVQAMEAAAIARAASAAFERGKLAAGEVRWADAAGHYGTAARLAPSYAHLFAAREMAWRSGDYPAALRWGEDLSAIRAPAVAPRHAIRLRRPVATRGRGALPAGAGDR